MNKNRKKAGNNKKIRSNQAKGAKSVRNPHAKIRSKAAGKSVKSSRSMREIINKRERAPKTVKMIKEVRPVKSDGSVPGVKSTHASTAKINICPPEEVRVALARLASNDSAVRYLKRKVSKRVLDVLNLLEEPKTDEEIAEKLDIKINAVRRILNMMQDSGITNYYVSKNVNGWLSFAWHINVSKLDPFFEYISQLEAKDTIINDQCNDYFVCDKCYEHNKMIFTFDSAFEESFKCSGCRSGLVMINKEDAAKLVEVQATQTE